MLTRTVQYPCSTTRPWAIWSRWPATSGNWHLHVQSTRCPTSFRSVTPIQDHYGLQAACAAYPAAASEMDGADGELLSLGLVLSPRAVRLLPTNPRDMPTGCN